MEELDENQRRQLREINARLARHEQLMPRAIAGFVVLGALVLLLVLGLLLAR